MCSCPDYDGNIYTQHMVFKTTLSLIYLHLNINSFNISLPLYKQLCKCTLATFYIILAQADQGLKIV